MLKKQKGDVVSLLELKHAAVQLGFEAEGYLLDADRLEGIEDYAIIPVGEGRTGSRSNPLHFVLVRFSGSQVFWIDPATLEEKPAEKSVLRQIWKGHALFISTAKK